MAGGCILLAFFLVNSNIFCTFAAEMKRWLGIGWLVCLLMVAGTSFVSADVIRLKSGKTIEGTILFENEEVIVIRDTAGTRYQYPVREVEASPLPSPEGKGEGNKEQGAKSKETDSKDVRTPSPQAVLSPYHRGRVENTLGEQLKQQETVNTGKKVAMGISVFGGGMAMPGQITAGDALAEEDSKATGPKLGGHAGAEVMVGTSNLFQRRIFLGGSAGYQAYMLGGQVLSFIPIKLRAEVPLMLTQHAPVLGMGVGYGIGLQNVKGGLCADIVFGWRYSYSRKGAFFMGVFADFEGAEVTLNETVSGKEYTSKSYRNLCGFGAKMTLYF